jgi:hypothetical protein
MREGDGAAKAARDGFTRFNEGDQAALITRVLRKRRNNLSSQSLAALETFLRIYPDFADAVYAILVSRRQIECENPLNSRGL